MTNHQLEYASEKFGSAIGAMAVSELPLRERIAQARVTFAPVALQTDALPDEVRDEVHAVVTAAARVDQLDDSQVHRLAQRIVDLAATIDAALP